MAYVQTVSGIIAPKGYFSCKNVEFIKRKVQELVRKDFIVRMVVDDGSVVRIMQRVLEERIDGIPRMNQRVIMYIVNNYLTYQIETNKHLNWAENFSNSQKLFDCTTRRGAISNWTVYSSPKLTPSTVRFYFT